MDNLVPCQFCNNLINFEDYQTHTDICTRRYIPSHTQFNNYINSKNPEVIASLQLCKLYRYYVFSNNN